MAIVNGGNISGNPSYVTVARNPPPELPMGPTVLQPGQQETLFRPAQMANDKLITRDRHAFVSRGTEKTGRDSGENDPLLSGPVRPSLRVINRTINFQVGTDATAATDDLSRNYTKDNDGQWVGTQDGAPTKIYGGVPGMYQPYGSYAGFTTGLVKGIQSSVPLGAPGDGPQTIPAGPPHGLHTATLPDYSQTLGRYMSVPQQVGGRVDRPSNSRIAGQSYSQTVQPQGQTGTVAVRVQSGSPRSIAFVSGPGWRGA